MYFSCFCGLTWTVHSYRQQHSNHFVFLNCPGLLTFTIIQCIELLNVRLTKTFPLTKLHAGLFKSFYSTLAILGEGATPIMHQTLEVVHGTKIIELTVRILIKIVSLTWETKKIMKWINKWWAENTARFLPSQLNLPFSRESTFEFVLHRDKILTSSWSFSADMADGSKTGQRPKYC